LKLSAASVQSQVHGSTIQPGLSQAESSADELSEAAILATPRCDPDGAVITHEQRRQAQTAVSPPAWRKNVTFDALGWHMAERLQASNLLAGDTVDVAFTVGYNDHPEYGGLELLLRDLKV
jgi:hypothetical protein